MVRLVNIQPDQPQDSIVGSFEVFMDGNWRPWFGGNMWGINAGANIGCRQLGYDSGIESKKNGQPCEGCGVSCGGGCGDCTECPLIPENTLMAWFDNYDIPESYNSISQLKHVHISYNSGNKPGQVSSTVFQETTRRSAWVKCTGKGKKTSQCGAGIIIYIWTVLPQLKSLNVDNMI